MKILGEGIGNFGMKRQLKEVNTFQLEEFLEVVIQAQLLSLLMEIQIQSGPATIQEKLTSNWKIKN